MLSLCAAGDLNIELHSDLAPRAAENFLVLADKGYYTGTKFHRSIKNFMVQVGSVCHGTYADAPNRATIGQEGHAIGSCAEMMEA